MSRSDVFFLFILCFFVGLLLGYFLVEKEFLKAGIFLLISLYFFLRVFGISGVKNLFLPVLVGVIFGVLRYLISVDSGLSDVKNFTGYHEFIACISDEPDIRADKVKYAMTVEKIKIDSVYRNVSGKLMVYNYRYPVFNYGDCFNLKGIISIPDKMGDFDYQAYLFRYGISAVVYKAEIELRSNNRAGYFYKNIFDFKKFFEGRLFSVFLEPYASFLDGLLLGSRRGINADLMNKFNLTGLSHIIAISGYNITLLIVIIGSVLSFLGQKTRIVCSILFIILFVILVGASSAVVRAGIMGVISLFALWFNRKYYVVLALFVSAFLMNLFNPQIFITDVGFQLSFLATFGLVFFSDSLKKYFSFIPDFLAVRESILLTLSAQIFAMPIILKNFGGVSLMSPVANLFVLPFVPLTMLFGFFSVLFSWISDVLSIFVTVFTVIFLKIIIVLVDFFSGMNFSYLKFDYFNFWFCLIYFFIILELFVMEKIRRPFQP